MQMQPGLWYMLSIVLAPTAVGLPGSLLNGRVLQGFNPATEILSYYVEGSTGIHPRFVNSQRLEYSASQLALRLGLPATTSPRQIANHDFAMGVISTDTVGSTGAMFPIRDRFYFTLTEAYASQLRALPFNIGGEPALSSHVYECIWDTSSLTWQAPGIAFHHDDLFTERAAGSVEIDALSVYMDASTNSKRVVFSLTPESDQWPDSVFDQILVHQQTAGLTSCPTTELKTNVGTKLSFKQGLRRRTGPGNTPSTGTPDDVKSACGGDPKDGDVVPPVMGLSTDEYRQGEGELGFTAVRRSPPDSAGDELHIQVTGLEHEGYMFGYVWLQLEGPPVPKGSTPAAPVPLGAPILLDAEALDLNSLDLMIPVPRAVGLAPMRFSAQLWGANPGNPPDVRLLRESWVLSVRM